MAKFTLDTEDDDAIDFALIGIVSHARSYRLCWSLNQTMRLHFSNTNTPIIVHNTKKKTSLSFEVFRDYDEENRLDFYLICNKATGGFLLPELKHLDYVLMVKDNLGFNRDALLAQIKESDQVLTALEINVTELKSTENLLF
jgi:hypothetical protein